MSKKNGGLFAGLLIGAAAGFAAGIFLAPKDGKNLRKDLSHQADDLLNSLGDVGQTVKEKQADLAQLAKQKMEKFNGHPEDLKEKVLHPKETAEGTKRFYKVTDDLEDQYKASVEEKAQAAKKAAAKEAANDDIIIDLKDTPEGKKTEESIAKKAEKEVVKAPPAKEKTEKPIDSEKDLVKTVEKAGKDVGDTPVAHAAKAAVEEKKEEK
ncbi:MAG: YtxH domain-containing protein [Enterococcaceae bacterium]|nr:YtxH domain-containing protein [Enterococcaceae bacterium]MCI1918710.1 YtxH domain-containing protein [Enterococcaceae bacterium]